MEGVEVDLAESVHEGVREVQFLVADGDARVGGDPVRRTDLVRPQQPVHGEDVVHDPQHAQPLAPTQRELADGDLPAALERLAEEGVRLGGGDAVRREVVRGVHLQRVDALGRYEALDLDGLGGRDGQRREVLVRDRDHRAVRVLVRLADLPLRHLTVLQLADLAVTDAAAVLRGFPTRCVTSQCASSLRVLRWFSGGVAPWWTVAVCPWSEGINGCVHFRSGCRPVLRTGQWSTPRCRW